ncbi:MAG: histidine--tRNA ligase [Deltaproteobacteria bacterium]|nr:histidine--tRNA ligase [Deltaproteobacteria bacterium]
MSISLQPVKGTRDFYPDDMRLRNWLFDIWRNASRRFGFEEYDACVLESEELYIRKAGDEITGQLYNFEDKGGRRIALRPEMTPSLARLVLQRQSSLTFPLKWFSIPQCFRYERMTRGRRREHFQWNADIVGQPDQMAELEALSLLLTAMRMMGLGPEHIRVHVNDRRLLDAILDHIQAPRENHLAVMVVMDKRDKITPEELNRLLEEQGLSPEMTARLNTFLAMRSLDEVLAELGECEAIASLRTLLERLEQSGLGGYARFDITVVRGLSYYTGTVFEVRDAGASLRAICGGGRYDSLLSTFGGQDVPAVGFGFGDVVILELLSDLGLLPQLDRELEFAVIPFSQNEAPLALQIAQGLREQGRTVSTDFSYRKLKKALQRADATGALKALLLLPDEAAQGLAVLRDMKTRTEETVPLAGIMEQKAD